MSIRTKNRRHITVNGKEYIWYVLPEKEGGWNILHICDMNKDMRIRAPLSPGFTGERIEYPFCYVSCDFNKVKQGDYLLPFEVTTSVTPSVVADIIKGIDEGSFRRTDYGELKKLNHNMWLFDMIF